MAEIVMVGMLLLIVAASAFWLIAGRPLRAEDDDRRRSGTRARRSHHRRTWWPRDTDFPEREEFDRQLSAYQSQQEQLTLLYWFFIEPTERGAGSVAMKKYICDALAARDDVDLWRRAMLVLADLGDTRAYIESRYGPGARAWLKRQLEKMGDSRLAARGRFSRLRRWTAGGPTRVKPTSTASGTR